MKRFAPLSLYWKCQLTGWSIAALYWSYDAFSVRGFQLAQGIADFLLDVLAGILITHLYRMLVLRLQWYRLSLKALVPQILPSIVILSALYSFFIAGKLYLVRCFFVPHLLGSFHHYFIENGLTLFITGTRLMSIWVLAYHLYHYAQREIAVAHENARLSVVAREAQLSRLAAQLNPHFFFNALNTIKFLTATNQASARRSVDLLSGLLRNTLYTRQDTLTSLREELQLVMDYLELENLRFEERLQYAVTFNDAEVDILIPPFSIQTLVENAIKHGIDTRRDGGRIDVSVSVSAGTACITVRNPGTLRPPTAAAGLGLKNLTERLQLQFGGRAGFQIMQAEHDIVQATITLPAA